MADLVLMPQMGVSEESALLAGWLVAEGDSIKLEQPLFSLETGKSSFEELSKHEGTLLKILIPAGEEVAVGAPVAVIGRPGEKFELPGGAPAEAKAAAAPKEAAPAAPAAAPAAVPTFATLAEAAEKAISPRARKLAGELGIDAAAAAPSGAEGRIIERDVKKLAAEGPAAAPAAAKAVAPAAPAADGPAYTDEAVSRIRRTIADNMLHSLTTSAQFTLSATFDATAIIELRRQMKNSTGYGLEKVSLNDFVIYALARTLPEFPDINAHFLEGKTMRRFRAVHVAVAVDTPRGLMVPVLRDTDRMSLREIAEQVKAKAAQCRDGAIDPAELSGGTVTLSNLGAYGVESFTPVINPPQTAILGVGGLTLRPRETADGEVEFYQAMGLSLTVDHRVVDGAPAAQFLKVLKERLENFTLLLAK